MSKKKSAYKGYSEDDVRRIEDNFFCLEVGGDYWCEEGFYLFTKKEVIKVYNKVLDNLNDLMRSDSDKDRAYAIDLLGRMYVRQIRLH